MVPEPEPQSSASHGVAPLGKNLRDRGKGVLVKSPPFAWIVQEGGVGRGNADKWWRWGMGLALPVAIGSACLDRRLLDTVMALWDDPTPARLTFLLSSTVLLVGFARNSARLRTLVENQPVPPPADQVPRQQPTPSAMLEPCND